jgi:hypothetical protein
MESFYIEVSYVKKSQSFFLTPLVHAACFLVDCKGLSPEKGQMFRSTFYRSIQYDDESLCPLRPACKPSALPQQQNEPPSLSLDEALLLSCCAVSVSTAAVLCDAAGSAY